MKRTICVLLLTAALPAYRANGQEFGFLGLFGKGKSMKLNGGLNAAFVYSQSSAASGREPFTMVAGGNLNLFFNGISVPISFSYSNAKVSASPAMYFNKFSLHPTYKWVTAHVGTTSMSFSPYTLNGHQFDGGGLELTPGLLKVKMMYGRLLRGTGDYLAAPDAIPGYKRMGGGVSAEYTWKGVLLGVSAFHAKDDSATAWNIPFEKQITPKENLATSVNTSFTLLKNIKVAAEYATSYLTQDQFSRAAEQTGKGWLSGMIRKNGSTVADHAVHAKASYAFQQSEAAVDYERVDAGYQCLGAYYNQNGFENTQLRYSTALFHKKLFIAPALGIQRDLSDSAASQQSKRLLTSMAATYTPFERLTLRGTYSNTSAVTNFRNLDNIASGNNLVPYYLDSIKLVQLNRNAGLDATYLLEAGRDKTQSLSASYTLQHSTKKQGDYFVPEEASDYHNGALMLSTSYPQTTVQWSAGFNYMLAAMGGSMRTTAYGPNFSFGKKLFQKKLSALLGVAYNTTQTNITRTYASVMNTRCNFSYTYKQRNEFRLSGIWQLRNTGNHITSVSQHGSDLLVTLNYNYNF